MKNIFCDRCGKPAMTEAGMKLSVIKPDEEKRLAKFDYEFDLCPECSEELLKDIQDRIVQRLTKGGDNCQTEG